MQLIKAYSIAERWLKQLEPYTERIQIAGSIRREKAEVKDIEIVCVPKTGYEMDLFQSPTPFSKLERFISDSNFILTKNGPRYKQIVTGEDIKIDLFIILPPAQWGVQLLIRTGSADYSHRFVTSKRFGGMLPSYMKVSEGAIWANGKIVETPEETDVYQVIDCPWVHPSERLK